ncbi:PREDICTED: regenerating islet-derived protein 4 [Lepidothrix coronata]|uniref:Regenerating islet-derived protein 4 n=1 Tax=Lepidothrix coronata TaxID=321398 RepID=A0A6J0H9C7_9PASS|nr:PREDICTED: regenerating islet-derived protein 4 [Lepidothrix coronata]XP_017671183.1 PREDICTED: regenerating islet-derived protein 4 [Lepidothrix coronata]XP_017671184.1 PREDICTED: regenerating islet-derived protein 4 [Lepidothrix coronata]
MMAAARLALLLLGCMGLLQPAAGRYISYCPNGWSYYKLNCFKYFPDVRTWDEAESQCQAIQDGAHLAWVEDQREAITLKKAISYYQRVQPVWLGLHYSEESQDWKWTGGDKYSTASGLSGNGASPGKCAMLTHQSSFSLWSSANCTQKHHYICKFTPLH